MQEITISMNKLAIGGALMVGLLIGWAIGFGASEHHDGKYDDVERWGYEHRMYDDENDRVKDPIDTKDSSGVVDMGDPNDNNAVKPTSDSL